MEPIYQCSLQCDQNQLNNLYSVILSRRGIIYEEDVIEGTTLFLLQAYIPIYNSFGFTQQLLKKTSGKGITPQLHLSHYQKLNKNPFWKPTTNDEIEIYGDNQNNSIEKINLSRTIIDQVRKRKGLIIEEKVVMYAEKQRTLNKKKWHDNNRDYDNNADKQDSHIMMMMMVTLIMKMTIVVIATMIIYIILILSYKI